MFFIDYSQLKSKGGYAASRPVSKDRGECKLIIAEILANFNLFCSLGFAVMLSHLTLTTGIPKEPLFCHVALSACWGLGRVAPAVWLYLPQRAARSGACRGTTETLRTLNSLSLSGLTFASRYVPRSAQR